MNKRAFSKVNHLRGIHGNNNFPYIVMEGDTSISIKSGNIEFTIITDSKKDVFHIYYDRPLQLIDEKCGNNTQRHVQLGRKKHLDILENQS